MPATSTYFKVTWPWSSADEAIAAWQTWAPQATDIVTSILHLELGRPAAISANGQYLGIVGQRAGAGRAAARASRGPPRVSTSSDPTCRSSCCWPAATAARSPHVTPSAPGPGGMLPRETFNAKSDYVAKPLPIAGRARWSPRPRQPGAGALLCDAYGGAIGRVAPDATAFVAPRAAVLHPVLRRRRERGLDRPGSAQDAPVRVRAWPTRTTSTRRSTAGSTRTTARICARLKATRKRVDPHHYFNFPQAIGR